VFAQEIANILPQFEATFQISPGTWRNRRVSLVPAMTSIPVSSAPSMETVQAPPSTTVGTGRWSAQQVSKWISSVPGMSQNYAAVFLYENIDGGVLLEMTDDDLKSVGVSKFGDRMVLVQAIGRLKEDLSDC
jgi:hypothetical protein